MLCTIFWINKNLNCIWIFRSNVLLKRSKALSMNVLQNITVNVKHKNLKPNIMWIAIPISKSWMSSGLEYAEGGGSRSLISSRSSTSISSAAYKSETERRWCRVSLITSRELLPSFLPSTSSSLSSYRSSSYLALCPPLNSFGATTYCHLVIHPSLSSSLLLSASIANTEKISFFFFVLPLIVHHKIFVCASDKPWNYRPHLKEPGQEKLHVWKDIVILFLTIAIDK